MHLGYELSGTRIVFTAHRHSLVGAPGIWLKMPGWGLAGGDHEKNRYFK
jgi:hypothetical protein